MIIVSSEKHHVWLIMSLRSAVIPRSFLLNCCPATNILHFVSVHFSSSEMEFISPYKSHSKAKHFVYAIPQLRRRDTGISRGQFTPTVWGAWISHELLQLVFQEFHPVWTILSVSQDNVEFWACSPSACQPFHLDVIHVGYKEPIYSTCLYVVLFIDRYA